MASVQYIPPGIFEDDPFFQRLVSDCKKHAIKAQVTPIEEEGLESWYWFFPGQDEDKKFTKITFYDEDNNPCPIGIVIEGWPYDLPVQPGGDHHQTFPLGQPPSLPAGPQGALAQVFSLAQTP